MTECTGGCGGVRDGVANCILRREHIVTMQELEKEHMAFTVEFDTVQEMANCAAACIEQSETVQDATDEAFTWIQAIHRFVGDDPATLQNVWFHLWQIGQTKFGVGRWNILRLLRDGYNPYTKRWLYIPNVQPR